MRKFCNYKILLCGILIKRIIIDEDGNIESVWNI